MSEQQEPENSQGNQFTIKSGQLIVPSAQFITADQRLGLSDDLSDESANAFLRCFGQPLAEALFVLGSIDDLDAESRATQEETADEDEPNVVVVRLGVITQEAVANHLPEVAERLTKPKTFFLGGEQDPMVTAVGWIKAQKPQESHRKQLSPEEKGSQEETQPQGEQRLQEETGPQDEQKPQQSELIFGAKNEFLRVRIDGDAPSIDEQVLSMTGSADPAALKGMRLFHSFEMVHKDQIVEWVEAGCVFIDDAEPGDVFTERPLETWRHIMKRRPFPENLFATWTDTVDWN